MKSIIAILVVTSFTTAAFAQKLLSCNPPMGSSLQEVKITQVGNKIYRSELNSSGSLSSLVEITAASWANKDLKWRSKDEGNVRMRLVTEKGRSFWLYQSTNFGGSINGYCDDSFQ